MRVLLTGAAGFIGSRIAPQLAAQGHEVVGVDAMIAAAHPVDASAPAGVHQLDLRDAADWMDLLKGVDVVCHQAAMVGAGVTVSDLPLYASHNDVGTACLLAAMHQAKVSRLVLASSMVVYGEGRYTCEVHGVKPPTARSRTSLDAGDFDHHCPRCAAALHWAPVPEEAQLAPRSSYAASKVAQENYVTAWVDQAPGTAIALRYHNVYGPGMPQDTPYSGVAAMFRSALARGQSPEVFEDGQQMRDFVHVDDVARANVLAVEAVAAATGTGTGTKSIRAYNICSGVPVSIHDVAVAVAAATDPRRAPVVNGRYRAGDVRHVVASPQRADRELGFRAAIGPGQGLAQFATAPLRPTRSDRDHAHQIE